MLNTIANPAASVSEREQATAAVPKSDLDLGDPAVAVHESLRTDGLTRPKHELRSVREVDAITTPDDESEA